MARSITFVTPSNSRKILEENLLASPFLQGTHSHEVLIQEGFSSAPKAYNDAIDKGQNDLIVFVHHDVILPASWPDELEQALTCLEIDDPNWGVLGSYGVTLNSGGRGYIYSTGLGILGKAFDRPAAVNTLDEIVLILRKSSGLRFDDTLPHFHMYGADICMAAAKRGMKSYAISAFCIHNSVLNLVLPKEFYESCKHVQRTRREFLPIQTTCVRVTRFGLPMYERRLREFHLKYIRNKTIGAVRESDSRGLLERINTERKEHLRHGEVACSAVSTSLV